MSLGSLSNTNKQLERVTALRLTQSKNNTKEHFSHSAGDVMLGRFFVHAVLAFLPFLCVTRNRKKAKIQLQKNV